MFTLHIDVTDQDIEPLYNHVHHANALKFLEKARLGFLAAIGCPNDQYIAQGLYLVISHISINYLREIKSGRITVSCTDVSCNKKKIQINQEVVNERGRLAIKAVVESQFLSAQHGRAILPPETFLKALEKSIQKG